MRRPKVSTRWMMAIVFVAGVALGLGVPAYRAWSDEEWHIHTYLGEIPPASSQAFWMVLRHGPVVIEMTRPSAWARFRGHLAGVDRTTMGDCGTRIGGRDETCSRAEPFVADEFPLGH